MHTDPFVAGTNLLPPPDFDPQALLATLAARYGLGGTLMPLSGERDRNLLLRAEGQAPLLVRIAHPDENPAETDLQAAVLLHLEHAGPELPVPRVRRAGDGAALVPVVAADGRTCLMRVLSYLPGQPMTQMAGPARARALGGIAARLDNALRDFRHPAETRRLVWDVRETPSLRRLLVHITDASLRDLLVATLDRFDAEAAPVLAEAAPQVIHNDLNPHNVLVDPDDPARITGIIDFGDVVRASCLQEVATACAYIIHPGESLVEAPSAFIAGYCAENPLTPAQIAVLPAVMAARMAVSVLVSGWKAGLAPDNAAYLMRNVPRTRDGLERLAALSAGEAWLR